MQIKFFILVRKATFFGTRREYCASEEGKAYAWNGFAERKKEK